ncbi:hypothetical protein CEUSTIGMA_g8026.t1 [Chlamydomonas eustigma]|uniref:B30.2/SPRY domain-containing protein n=1 Tax=Chlamydomonas eustigma TaxID=1157962 RepID=A0A250XCH2_9CHLO|nr:hypothetical protein CEUSTIGMA_g8026.t1 [Chlamydomonas eustigma]|eukprot:GAX80589.1 hypothetical protein CEUSTIGMA_g8026.t1 [Chlamydomonas eustigma]
MAVECATLNPLDCNLDIDLRDGNLTCSKLSSNGFGYLWAGARGNVGMMEGKAFFSVRVTQALPVNVQSKDDLSTAHIARLGVSRLHTPVGQLGEVEHSWGFGGTGRVATGNTFKAYGESFGPGDVIVCLVDLSPGQPSSISFIKNGVFLGKAFDISVPADETQAYFPHVLIKNSEVALDFSSDPVTTTPWSDQLQGYVPWQKLLMKSAQHVIVPHKLQEVPFNQCELLMLVGLPGTGKTTWATEYVRKNVSKRYMILGTSMVIDQMKVPRHNGRFEGIMAIATEIFKVLLQRASQVPRNFILDQTNVHSAMRQQKIAPFLRKGFLCKAAVFVVHDPELFQRQNRQFSEQGKVIPDEAIAEMKEVFTIPSLQEGFSSVELMEQKGSEAARIVEEQRSAGRRWLDWHRSHKQQQQQQHAGSTQLAPSLQISAPDAAVQPQQYHVPAVAVQQNHHLVPSSVAAGPSPGAAASALLSREGGGDRPGQVRRVEAAQNGGTNQPAQQGSDAVRSTGASGGTGLQQAPHQQTATSCFSGASTQSNQTSVFVTQNQSFSSTAVGTAATPHASSVVPANYVSGPAGFAAGSTAASPNQQQQLQLLLQGVSWNQQQALIQQQQHVASTHQQQVATYQHPAAVVAIQQPQTSSTLPHQSAAASAAAAATSTAWSPAGNQISTDTSATQIPANWYWHKDSNGWRWWDGTQWTDAQPSSSTSQVAASAPATGGAVPAVAPESPAQQQQQQQPMLMSGVSSYQQQQQQQGNPAAAYQQAGSWPTSSHHTIGYTSNLLVTQQQQVMTQQQQPQVLAGQLATQQQQVMTQQQQTQVLAGQLAVQAAGTVPSTSSDQHTTAKTIVGAANIPTSVMMVGQSSLLMPSQPASHHSQQVTAPQFQQLHQQQQQQQMVQNMIAGQAFHIKANMSGHQNSNPHIAVRALSNSGGVWPALGGVVRSQTTASSMTAQQQPAGMPLQSIQQQMQQHAGRPPW